MDDSSINGKSEQEHENNGKNEENHYLEQNHLNENEGNDEDEEITKSYLSLRENNNEIDFRSNDFAIRYREDYQPHANNNVNNNINNAEIIHHEQGIASPLPNYASNGASNGFFSPNALEHQNSSSSPLDRTPPNEVEDEVFQLIPVVFYHDFQQTLLKVNRTITGRDICRALERKLTLTREDGKFYSLVCVITIIDPQKRSKVYCVRTIFNDEIVLNIQDILIQKLMLRYSLMDYNRLKNSTRWFYKDVRTPPILLEDNYQSFDTIGEDSSSEDEEELTHSDLNYLVKSERKGYLLKRSSKDINLWKKWYCVLTDHLWCLDINRTTPKTICIRLNGVQRSRNNQLTGGEQIHNIIINSTKVTHLLRAFTLIDQRKWIEDLHQRAIFSTDNDYFNMAEVIICDEEISKNRRYQKLLQEYINTPCITQAISEDYYQFYHANDNPPLAAEVTHLFSSPPHYSSLGSSISADQLARAQSEEDLRRSREGEEEVGEEEERKKRERAMTELKKDDDNNNEDIVDFIDNDNSDDDDEEEEKDKRRKSTEKKGRRKRRSRRKSSAGRDDEFKDIGRPVVEEGYDDDDYIDEYYEEEGEEEGEYDDEEGEYSDEESINLLYKLLNPMDRTITTFFIHQLHTRYHSYYTIFQFLLEILQYKELFRIDLYTTSKAHRIYAINLFINYLIPQIINDLHKEQIVYQVLSSSDITEKMKRNGINHVNYLFYKSNNIPITTNDKETAVGGGGGGGLSGSYEKKEVVGTASSKSSRRNILSSTPPTTTTTVMSDVILKREGNGNTPPPTPVTSRSRAGSGANSPKLTSGSGKFGTTPPQPPIMLPPPSNVTNTPQSALKNGKSTTNSKSQANLTPVGGSKGSLSSSNVTSGGRSPAMSYPPRSINNSTTSNTINNSNMNRSRFPVYNAVKNEFNRRRQLSIEKSQAKETKQTSRKGGNNGSAGGGSRKSIRNTGNNNSNKEKFKNYRSSVPLQRENSTSSLSDLNFYWGISEENIMKIFLKLFPPDMNNNSTSATPRDASQTPKGSKQSVDDLMTPGNRATVMISKKPSSNAMATTPTNTTTSSSGWSWWWGGSTSTTPQSGAKPPSVQNPTTPGKEPESTYNSSSTPPDSTNPFVTSEIFDEIVEEIIQILKKKDIVI